jgi:hypothetical protein
MIMRVKSIIFVLTMTACFNQAKRENFSNLSDTIPEFTNLYIDELQSLAVRDNPEYLDSGNFRITREYFPSGGKFLEIYQDHKSKLDLRNEYFENGRIKESGQMTSQSKIKVGIWKYYSQKGEVDSLVDHDSEYTVSYFDALAIAKRYELTMPEIEISVTNQKQKRYWQIALWQENEDHVAQTSKLILIDMGTGKVTKPDYVLTAIH